MITAAISRSILQSTSRRVGVSTALRTASTSKSASSFLTRGATGSHYLKATSTATAVTPINHNHATSSSHRFKSSVAVEYDDNENFDFHQPMGDLFGSKLTSAGAVGQNMVGKTASIRRVFGPSANAQGLLTCGGEELARHASFDPDYETAKDWIRSRAIGPAVLSPVLISGLVGALVEAAFPQSVPMSSSMEHFRPLIVGVEVCARIQVESVKETERQNLGHDSADRGYEIALTTQVVRVQDDAVVSEGTHKVWIPSYLTM